MANIVGGWGSAPDPASRTYSAPLDPLAEISAWIFDFDTLYRESTDNPGYCAWLGAPPVLEIVWSLRKVVYPTFFIWRTTSTHLTPCTFLITYNNASDPPLSKPPTKLACTEAALAPVAHFVWNNSSVWSHRRRMHLTARFQIASLTWWIHANKLHLDSSTAQIAS